jgi:hypothetical protein
MIEDYTLLTVRTDESASPNDESADNNNNTKTLANTETNNVSDKESDPEAAIETTGDEGSGDDLQSTPLGCGIFGRYPIASLLIFVAVGTGVGVGLSFWTPDDPNTKKVVLQWLGLVGDLFLRYVSLSL